MNSYPNYLNLEKKKLCKKCYNKNCTCSNRGNVIEKMQNKGNNDTLWTIILIIVIYIVLGGLLFAYYLWKKHDKIIAENMAGKESTCSNKYKAGIRIDKKCADEINLPKGYFEKYEARFET